MPNNLFNPANFDPAQMPANRVVIFDDTGYVSDGGLSDPDGMGYNQTTTDAYLASVFAWNNLSALVHDIDAQFPDATYYLAINSVISGPSGTTYYIDHGYEGTSGSDVIQDVSGDTIARTGGGADLIMLGQGTHYVDAGGGDDVVVLGHGDDVVKLGGGNDWLWANGGNDAVRAGGGDDTVLGREGEDTLSGGGGADRLNGGADNDKLRGGNGADVFVFETGTGRDVVRDFETGVDTIEIAGFAAFQSFGDLTLTQAGSRVLIDLGNGDEIVLRNLQVGDLSASDFDFI